MKKFLLRIFKHEYLRPRASKYMSLSSPPPYPLRVIQIMHTYIAYYRDTRAHHESRIHVLQDLKHFFSQFRYETPQKQ